MERIYDALEWSTRHHPVPTLPIPAMTDYRTFDEYFETLDIHHFTAEEFTSYFHVHRRGVTNSEPPRELWGNIVPTIRLVDRLRGHFGKPIVLLSSYRSPAYNRAIGDAAPQSLHMQFRALDIAVAGKTPRQVFNVLQDWRERGDFKGGLGLYSTFVHVDTRGRDATWGT